MHFSSAKIITKKNKEVILRMAEIDEAKVLIDAVVEIALTSPYILMTAEDFRKTKVEDEEKWIEGYNSHPQGLLIIAELDKKIVGVLDFRTYKNAKMAHRGALGISLHDSVRGEGLGELLFKKLFEEVSRNISGLEIMELSVMGDNIQAFHLYQKVGFKEIARRPKAFKQPDGSYCDEILMEKKI